MKRNLILALVSSIALFSAGGTLADVHVFQNCQLNEGKAAPDVYPALASLDEFIRNQKGIPELKSMQVLWPIWGDDTPQGTFYIHRVLKGFKELGATFHEFFDGDMPSFPANDVFECSQTNVAWSASPG